MSTREHTLTSDDMCDIVDPHAPALIESLRAFGYDLSTALADLADNSLYHGARNISIHFHWSGDQSAIVLIDDGSGMDEKTLVNAMRVGSRNPREKRDPEDYGRFGLGLKTASFSQCRCMTVFTKRNKGGLHIRRWDLDHVADIGKWQLLRKPTPLAERLIQPMNELGHGTAIVWEKLDRLTANAKIDNDMHEDAFLEQADHVAKYFAAVFHRRMEGSRPVVFSLNNQQIKPWDPFLSNETATQRLPMEKLRCREDIVEVHPFVLPHMSKLDPELHQSSAGIRGWNAHQGFYIYRNQRLLVLGDWLGLKGWRQEEHYKLARIRIDLPNSLDHEWKIDVTKSKARPPEEMRQELIRIGEHTRGVAKRIYSHRGAKLVSNAETERVFLWEQTVKHSHVSYRLNRQHPLLLQVRESCTDIGKLSALIRLIEETIPVPLITITDREKPDQTTGPFEQSNQKEILDIMRKVFDALCAGGLSQKDALLRLSNMEPFPYYPQLLQVFREEYTA